jgi:hypothetical protein
VPKGLRVHPFRDYNRCTAGWRPYGRVKEDMCLCGSEIDIGWTVHKVLALSCIYIIFGIPPHMDSPQLMIARIAATGPSRVPNLPC